MSIVMVNTIDWNYEDRGFNLLVLHQRNLLHTNRTFPRRGNPTTEKARMMRAFLFRVCGPYSARNAETGSTAAARRDGK